MAVNPRTQKQKSMLDFTPPLNAAWYDAEVDTILADLETGNGVADFVLSAQARLERQLANSKQYCEQTINKICPEAKGDIHYLNTLLDKVMSEVYNLTGPSMVSRFIDPGTKTAKKQRAAENKALNIAFQQFYAATKKNNSWATQYLEFYKKQVGEVVTSADWLVAWLNSLIVKDRNAQAFENARQTGNVIGLKHDFYFSQTKFSSTRAAKSRRFQIVPKGDSFELKNLTVDALTDEQLKAVTQQAGRLIQQIFAEQYPDEKITVSQLKRGSVKVTRTSTDGVKTEILGADVTQGGSNLTITWTTEKREDMETYFMKRSGGNISFRWLYNNDQNYKNFVNNLNRVLKSNVSNPDLMQKVLQKMLIADPLSIYYGGNLEKGVTGFIGEIAAAYAIKSINPSIDINYTAHELDRHGKQLHVDFLIDKIAGLQVKNTATKTISNVDFRSGQLVNIFNQYRQAGKTVGAAIALESFNVPYVYNQEDRSYHSASLSEVRNTNNQGRGEMYADAYNRLQDALWLVRLFLQFTASSMMFLDVGEKLERNASDIFLLGTQTFVTTYQIIELLYNEFMRTKDQSNYTSSYYNINISLPNADDKEYDAGNTIIDYFNEGTYYRKLPKEERPENYRPLSDYLKRVVVSTSFNFSELINQNQSKLG